MVSKERLIMNTKKFSLACIAIFIFIVVFEFLFHGVYMQNAYEQTTNLWRAEDEMQKHMPWLILGQFIIACGFVALFTKAFKRGGIPEGAIYGFLLAIIFCGHQLIGYAVSPYPLSLLINWIIGTLIELTLAGILVALIFRSRA